MKLQILALPLLAVLMLSPMLATASSGSITFSSPTSGATFTGTQSYTISGTITPTPTLPDNVVITVTLQGGSPSPVDEATEAVSSTGTFSYSTNVGGSSAWITGTYLISAFDSYGTTGTTTFKYTSAPTTTSGYVTIEAPSLLLQGQTGNIFVWSSQPGSVTAWVLAPGATSTVSLTASRVSPNPGGLYVYEAAVAISATAPVGVYLVGASVANSTTFFSASNIGSFTVNTVANQSALATVTSDVTGLANLGKSIASLNSSIASLNAMVSTISGNVNTIGTNVNSISSTLSTVSGDVNTLSTTLGTLSSTVNTLSTSVSSISSSISTLTSDVQTMQTTVSGLGNLASDMTSLQSSVSSLSSSVSNAQTYILVVAALAVITLVLELAILIRKMS
jgi:trimeric autotransporter adhesin